jgi:3-oxoadipate enol-lactonase / 4-carboxymuconolactone decarboxylase
VSRTRYACSGEWRIAYELRGMLHRRRPWLVLIQGMGFDRFRWEPVLRKLRRHFRLVLVDNRGSGYSDLPTGSSIWRVISSPCSMAQVSAGPT